MKRVHSATVHACSRLAGHWGASIIGLAVILMASAASPAWGQSAWPSYPNNGAISVTSSGNVGIGTTALAAEMVRGFVADFLASARRRALI